MQKNMEKVWAKEKNALPLHPLCEKQAKKPSLVP
jgi:hypothetical protein